MVCAGSLMLAACSSDSTNNTTTGDGPKTQKDGGSINLPDKVECNSSGSDCKDFVFNRFLVPLNAQDSTKFGFQFDGSSHNKLGDILTFIAGTGSMPLQEEMDLSVHAGLVILLQRIKASDFTTDPQALGQAWRGVVETCCSDKTNKTTCATESATQCFNGSKEFTVDPTATQKAVFGGSISSGKFNMSAPQMSMELPLGSQGGSLKLNLKQVQVKGTISGDTIKSGVLAGAMSEEEVTTNLVPSLVKILNDLYTAADTEQATKDMLKIFDKNNDKEIKLDEVNSLMSSFLVPDVDLNGDKKSDHLSFGVGYEAVKASIKGE
jgi:hypothetical protein